MAHFSDGVLEGLWRKDVESISLQLRVDMDEQIKQMLNIQFCCGKVVSHMVFEGVPTVYECFQSEAFCRRLCP